MFVCVLAACLLVFLGASHLPACLCWKEVVSGFPCFFVSGLILFAFGGHVSCLAFMVRPQDTCTGRGCFQLEGTPSIDIGLFPRQY